MVCTGRIIAAVCSQSRSGRHKIPFDPNIIVFIILLAEYPHLYRWGMNAIFYYKYIILVKYMV